MPQGARNDYHDNRDSRIDARQREQDHDLELDRQRKYDGTFRPEDPNYHRERIARRERSWGGERAAGGGYANAEYPYSGQGRGDSYGEGYQQPRDQHHANYLKWRGDYIRQLDGQYEDYRAESQSKFDQDFDNWRDENRKRHSSNPTADGEAVERAKRDHHH